MSMLHRHEARASLVALALALAGWGACAAKPEARVAREIVAPKGLTYRIELDSTRLRRASGLSSVAAVAELVEDNLSRFFKLPDAPAKDGPAPDERMREIIAEAPAPGFAVRATIEQRPDDYCMVNLEAVALTPGSAPTTALEAPYSVHFGLAAARSAIQEMRPGSWPVLSAERFTILRQQATELAARGEDASMDEATFARTPRAIERADDPPRYFAPPSDVRSHLRPE